MFTAILIIFFILFGATVWYRPDWGIYLLILGTPTYLVRFNVMGVPATLLEGMILVLSAVWLIKKFKFQSSNLKFPRELILPVGLFLLAATIAVFISADLRAAAGIWKAYFIEPVLFFIVFINVIKTERQKKNIIWVLGLSVLIPGLLAIYQKFTGVFIPNEFWAEAATRRVTSVYGFPNAIGLYFAPVVTLLVGILVSKLKRYIQERNFSKPEILRILVTALLISVSTLSIIFAQSKGAILAIAIGLIFYIFFWKGLRMWFAGLIVVGLVCIFLFFPNLLSTQGTSTVAGGGSLEVRTEQWSEALAMLKTKPIFGAGLSGYQQAVAPYHAKDYIEIFIYPHQIVLNFWSEIGLLGLLAFIWLIVIFFREGFKPLSLQNNYQIPIIAAMVTLIAHGLVDVPYFKNDLSVLYWILFGLIVISRDQSDLNKFPK